jgi:hypothetical protein
MKMVSRQPLVKQRGDYMLTRLTPRKHATQLGKTW